MERNKNYSTEQWFQNNSNNISLLSFDMKHQNMPNPEINTFWFNICISFQCWWKKQVSQVVVSGQNRVLQGIWSKGTSLWRLDWWTKVLLSLSDHALSKTHTLGLLLWLVWGLHLSKLLICRMVMPSIKNDPQTNTTEAHLPSLPPEAISHLKSRWSPNSTNLHCVTRAPLLYFIRSWVQHYLSKSVSESVSQSGIGNTCPNLHFLQYKKAWMSSTDPVSSITNCYRLIVSFTDPVHSFIIS